MSSTAAMPTSALGFTPQMAKDTLAYLRRAIEKMKALQTTEKAIASFERVMLNRAPEKFELKPLVTAINTLNLALREKAESKITATRTLVDQELETALQILARRDEAVRPSHLRQFCEREDSTLNLNTLAALISFYRFLPPTPANRGKYDFVVTRMFSHPEPTGSRRQRQLRTSREQIAKRLTEMCAAWGETTDQDSAELTQIPAILMRFAEFIAEVKQLQSFESLIGQFFFQRLREFKADLGPMLYLPEVTAASVESNVIITNRFFYLLEQECNELHQTSAEIQQLVDALSDTYNDEPGDISCLLAEIQANSHKDEITQHFARLFQFADHPVSEADIPIPPFPALLPEAEAAIEAPPELIFPEALPTSVSTEEPELEAFAAAPGEESELAVFAADPENEALLLVYRKASPEAKRLELSFFLAPLPDGGHEELQSEAKFRRASLELIFQTDQLIQTELGEDCELGDDIEPRVDKLFDALGQRSDEMRDLIQVALKLDQSNNYDALLHVYNQLMRSRLRLQSAIVRRTSSELAPDEAQRKNVSPQVQSKDQHTASSSEVQEVLTETSIAVPTARRKWMVIAILLLAVIAVGVHFATTGKKVVAKDDSDVVLLMKNQVPSGGMFAEIKLHRDLLLCIATEQWLTLSSREQTERLRELLRFGQEHGATRILLLDAKGITVGSATKDDLYVN